MAKRGLLVSYYFPPTGGGGVQRWTKLLKYLSGYGWDFSVISNDHSPSSPKDETLLNDIPEPTKIIRIPSSGTIESIKNKTPVIQTSGYWQRWSSAFIHVTDSRTSWNSLALTYLDKELSKKNYQVIILSCPPYSLSFLAAELTKTINCPVILDLRDPWTINPYKIYPTILHRILDKRRERKSITNIKYLISAYHSTVEEYKKSVSNFESKKILVLPNGYDEMDFEWNNTIGVFEGGRYNIGFSGSVYSHLNTPNPIFKAMKHLINEGLDIHFHHVGTSVHNLEKLAKRYDIEDNLRLWGYTEHKKSLQILQKMDVLCLILDDRWPRAENTIGGKFYEYLRLKIPIFAIVHEKGEAAKLIKKTNSGVIVSAKDQEQVVNGLRSLIIDNKRYTWDNIEEYSRENQAAVLNDYLESLI